METKVEALQDNQVKVTVTIDAKEIDNRIKKTYKDFAQKYNFPGFRKGKAPRPVIDNALGAETVRVTVTDDVVNGYYPLAIDAECLYPAGKPEFDEPALVEAGKDYSFSFTQPVKPEFELSSYEPVAVELPAEGASDAEVEEQIQGLLEHYFTLEDASAATKVKEENSVELAVKAFDDKGDSIDMLASDSRTYAMGSGLFPASFDAEILGMKKGQTKEFTIDTPASGESLLMSGLAGKTEKVKFEVEVKIVKKKVLPELTDEWAQETLGFENVADLRSRMADSIAQQKADILPSMKENLCMDVLAGRLQGEAPAGLVEEAESSLLQDFFSQLQRQGVNFDTYLMQQGITSAQFKEDVKKQAEDVVKQDLALDAWARNKGMVVTEEDLSAEFALSGAKDPKALLDEWRKNGQLYLIRQGLLRQRAALDVMDTAVVTEIDLLANEKPAKKSSEKKAEEAAAEEAAAE